MWLNRIKGSLRSSHSARLTVTTLFFLCLFGFDHRVRAAGVELVVLPKHFTLHPGEQIHYNLIERPQEGTKVQKPCKVLVGFGCPDVEFATKDPTIVRLIDPKGLFEAVKPGRTQLVMRAPRSEAQVTLEVTGPSQPPMMGVPYSTVREIAAKDLLIV